MTTEEAIKILDNCRIKADCARDETLPAEAEKEREDYIEACTMAIEVLKKQIPKRPKIAGKKPYGFSWSCPTCGGEAFHEICMDCGQSHIGRLNTRML